MYFLTYGVSTRKTTVWRKEKDGSSVEVKCPQFVADYNKYMNGVDAHDQLRLQRYSVQRSLRAKKYYKSLFFGLLDMALVNAYVVHCQYCKSLTEPPMSHAQFCTVLHEQLLNLHESDFLDVPSPTPSSASPRLSRFAMSNHRLHVADDESAAGRARYCVCKVCSILHSDQ